MLLDALLILLTHTLRCEHSHVRILAMLGNVCDTPFGVLNLFFDQKCPHKIVGLFPDDSAARLELVLAACNLLHLPL